MLKFSIKNDIRTSLKEVKFGDLGMSPDLSLISATCTTEETINNNDVLFIVTDTKPNGFYQKVQTSSFSAIGEFLAPTKYLVKSFKNYFGEEIKYVLYKDNLFYYNRMEDKTNIYLPNGYNAEIKDNYITVLDKYYITNDVVIGYDGVEYNCFINHDIDTDGIHTTTSFVEFEESGKTKILDSVTIYETPITKTILYFPVTETNLRNIIFENATCCVLKGFLQYNDNIFPIQTINDEHGTRKTFADLGNGLSATPIDNCYTFLKTEDVINNFIVNDAEKTTLVPLYDYKPSNYGYKLLLYLKDPNFALSLSNQIVATSIDADNYRLLSNFELFSSSSLTTVQYITGLFFNGKIYYKQLKDCFNHHYDFLLFNDGEYEIHYTNDNETTGYIEYNGTELYFNFTSNSDILTSEYKFGNNVLETYNVTQTLDDTIYSAYTQIIITTNNKTYNFITTKDLYAYRPLESANLTVQNSTIYFSAQPFYGVKRYDFIEIDNVKYKVEYSVLERYSNDESQKITREYVILDKTEQYDLEILNLEGENTVLCQPIIPNSILFTPRELEEIYSNISFNIAANFGNFEFTLKNTKWFTDIKLDESVFRGSHHSVLDNNVQIFKEINYYNIPLITSQNNAINANQTDLLTKLFIPTEISKSINNIVDMDKDVYYPFYEKKSGETPKEVDKIVINLHFRTRNLDTWKINEDYTDIYSPNKHLSESNKISPNFDKTRTNWFCIDYYSGTTDDENLNTDLTINIDKNLVQACHNSDLMWFLNFTNNDIFYQKSKITMSFVRLLFYDSKDPSTQSLLYQSTCWLDSALLYKQYINNLENKQYYNLETKSISSTISVSNEPYLNNTFTFNNNERLSCQITLNNRYNEKSSSEGFYLFLFKELSEGLCEKTIYMKVVFNHAGEGVSSLFTIPRKNGKKLEFNATSIKTDIDYLKNGIKISEVLDNIYIPVKIKFDKTINKFIYTLDSNLIDFDNNNTITLNMFEIKMKDESN